MFSQLLQSRHRYQPRIQSPTAFPAGKCQPGGSFPGRSKPSSVAEHPCQQSSNRAQLLVFRKQKSQFPNSFLKESSSSPCSTVLSSPSQGHHLVPLTLSLLFAQKGSFKGLPLVSCAAETSCGKTSPLPRGK